MMCCVCGFNKKHGVIFGSDSPGRGLEKSFACTDCFSNPDLFFPAKKILDHWVLKRFQFPLWFFFRKAKK